ncbi:hypothetical protein TPA4_65 [Tsukamurella phage TPA4]|uniref:hypothetical protein n=1 Tax=Tsukamurella phage TPA4 TaxID=1647476 RepID=UPI0007B62AE4|nr:hypothetical protein BH784_gp65 [Tsukamurella phage TPA4]AKJ72230.1 hypothetical protein TPA4_65 [Tsukamurella phage TPA4]
MVAPAGGRFGCCRGTLWGRESCSGQRARAGCMTARASSDGLGIVGGRSPAMRSPVYAWPTIARAVSEPLNLLTRASTCASCGPGAGFRGVSPVAIHCANFEVTERTAPSGRWLCPVCAAWSSAQSRAACRAARRVSGLMLSVAGSVMAGAFQRNRMLTGWT